MAKKKTHNLKSAREATMRLAFKRRAVEYRTTTANYCLKLINEIIYNDSSQLVCSFKDYLLREDDTDFVQKFLCSTQVASKLKNLLNFYATSALIFPSYTKLPEQKYIYKNIERKNNLLNRPKPVKSKEIDTVLNTEIVKELEESSSQVLCSESSIDKLTAKLETVIANSEKPTPTPKQSTFVSLKKILNTKIDVSSRNFRNEQASKSTVKVKLFSSTPISALLKGPSKSVLKKNNKGSSPFFSTTRFELPSGVKKALNSSITAKTRNKVQKIDFNELLLSLREGKFKVSDRKNVTARLRHVSEGSTMVKSVKVSTFGKRKTPKQKEVQILASLLKRKNGQVK